MSNIVMVPVPEEYLPDVYVLLADKQRGKSEVDKAKWTDEELRDLSLTAHPTMKVVLRYLAEKAVAENAGEEKVDARELAELVYGEGAHPQRIGGALGSFTKSNKSKYGKTEWPFHAAHNKEKWVWEYWMDADVAEKILRFMA